MHASVHRGYSRSAARGIGFGAISPAPIPRPIRRRADTGDGSDSRPACGRTRLIGGSTSRSELARGGDRQVLVARRLQLVGKGDSYAYRKRCHPGAIAPRWTRERVRAAMRAWQDRYDKPPSSYEWSRTHARAATRRARTRAARGRHFCDCHGPVAQLHAVPEPAQAIAVRRYRANLER
jgi:hypothetical protein